MSGLGKIIKGAAFFLIGYLTTIIINMFMPTLIEVGNAIFPSPTIEEIAWIIVFLVWALLLLVYPNYLIYTGLQESKEQLKGFMGGIVGGLMFFLNLWLTIKAWYMVPILYNLSSTGIIQGLFIIGLFVVWLEMQVIIPAYLILNSTKR